MNTCIFTGRLTADVELKTTTNGVSVCSFTLAVKRPRQKDKTDFINFVAWRNTAEYIAKYFRKGNKMACKGALTARKYEDANGKNRTIFEVEVDEVEFCESKQDTAMGNAGIATGVNFEEVAPDDNLPF